MRRMCWHERSAPDSQDRDSSMELVLQWNVLCQRRDVMLTLTYFKAARLENRVIVSVA